MRRSGADPYDSFMHLRDRVNELFAERETVLGRRSTERAPAWVPGVDVYDTPEAVEVYVELSGVKQEDLDVEVTGQVVTIAGLRRADHEPGERLHRLERRVGPFRRSFALAEPVVAGAVKARLAEGLLRLTLPKAK